MTPSHLYHGRHITQIRQFILAGNRVSAAQWIELELGKDDERFGVGKIDAGSLHLNLSGGVDFWLKGE